MQQLPESKMHLFFNSKLTAYKVEKEEIDHLLACEGLVKHIVLYHNRRFTNLGYCVVVSSLSALPQHRRLLSETHRFTGNISKTLKDLRSEGTQNGHLEEL